MYKQKYFLLIHSIILSYIIKENFNNQTNYAENPFG
jgi:hypothetical protein